MSQNFDILLSVDFMECRKFNQKKSTKSSRFFVIKSKPRPKFLRHGSLQWFAPVECYEEAPKVLKGLMQY